MEHNEDKQSQFYVVHFLHEPFKEIDYYVCVPFTWVKFPMSKHVLYVAYPEDKDPFVIRELAKKKEKYGIDWATGFAELKYESDTYEDAELWISTNNNRRLLIRKNSNTHGSGSVPWDHELRSGNQKYSSKSEDKSKRTKPNQISKKRSPKSPDKESYKEAKKKLYLKRLKWKNETAKSTAQNADLQPVSSTESTTIRDEPSMESTQAEKTAATNGAKSTEGSSHSTDNTNNDEQEPSMLVIDIDAINDVVNSEDQSQHKQPGEANGNQNQLSSNLAAAPKPPSPIEQTPHLNQHHDQRIRIKDVQTLIASSNNQEPRYDSTSNTRQITSQLTFTPDLCKQIENSKRNIMIAAQTSSNPIDLTQPLPKPLTQSSPASIQNPVHQEPPILIANSMNFAPVAGIMTSSLGIQHVTGMNTVPATDPRVVYSVASVTAPQNLPQLHQSPVFFYQGVQQNLPVPPEHMLMPGQGLFQIPTQSLDPRLRGQYNPISQFPQYQPVRPSFNNNPTNVPSQFLQPQEIQHQEQRTGNHQDAQRPQASVYIPILPKNDRRNPTLQGVKKTTPPPTSSRVPNSVHQALLTALENYPLNEQEWQAILSKIPKEQRNPGLMNVLRNIAVLQAHCSHRSKMSAGSSDQSSMEPSPIHQNVGQNPRPQVDQSNKANPTMKQVNFQDDAVRSASKQTTVADSGHQTNVCMPEPLSPSHSAALDSEIEMDHETAFGYEMSVDESHDVVNATDQIGHNSVDRSTAQNSLSKLALQQQMVEQFATVCSQVSSTLHNTANVFDSLQNSLLETAKSYQTFFDNERINASENSANHVSSSSNVAEEVPPVIEERQNSAPERRNSSNGNQSNGVSKPPKRTHQKNSKHLLSTQDFLVPPENDPNDTKWTLKYREYMPGHLELLPQSNIYVRYSELKRCKEVSNSCESLAQMMLHEVFNEKALGVCASITEAVKINYKTSPDARPPLDNHGSLVLLNYVLQCGVQFGWSKNVAKILNTLDQEVKKMRFK